MNPDKADIRASTPAASLTPVRRHRKRPGRRKLLIALVVGLALLAGIGGGSAYAYEMVKSKAASLQAQLTGDLRAGQADLEAGKANLKAANANHDVGLVNKAQAEFGGARAEFLLTRQTADGSQLLQQIERLPDVGPQARAQHKAVDGVADMGMAISEAGLELSALAAEIIAPPKGSEAGRTLLTVLDQSSASLVKVKADLQRADQAAASVNVDVVPASQQATFAKARATIASALAGMDQFQTLVPIIKEVLGGNGPRTYLVEQVNPAELRPGGGFIGTYSVLRADQGSLQLLQGGDAYDLVNPRPVRGQRGYVAPPGPFLQLIGNESWSFIDSNFSPDFPTNAQVAESFVSARLGVQIDGVVAIDYYTIAKLLDLTGPLTVPGFGITMTSSNFISTVVQADISSDPSHKAILAATAGPLMQRLASLPPERWPAFLAALNGLATTHNLQAYFNNASVEKQVVGFGWSGENNPTGASDFLAEVESNLGGTKANYYTTRAYTISLTSRGSLLHHVVSVQLVNNTPYFVKPNDFYRAYVRLLFPENATLAWDNMKSMRLADPNPPAGTQQLTGWATIPGYGNRDTAFFEYDTPWTANRHGEHDIYWQKQPGTVADAVTINWQDESGDIYSTTGSFTQDMLIRLLPRGVALVPAQPATAALPSLSLG